MVSQSKVYCIEQGVSRELSLRRIQLVNVYQDETQTMIAQIWVFVPSIEPGLGYWELVNVKHRERVAIGSASYRVIAIATPGGAHEGFVALTLEGS